jgi:chlorite dismutase
MRFTSFFRLKGGKNMKRMTNLILFVILSTVLISFTSINAKASEKLDKMTILKSKGVIGTFGVFKAEPSWQKIDFEKKKSVLVMVKHLIESYSDRVIVDMYSTLGLTKDSDFFLRLHAYDLVNNYKFIRELLSSNILGNYFSLRDLHNGITKGLNYAHKTPDLLTKLKATKYKGDPPVFGIVVTVDKTSDWWNLDENKRLGMIKEHTVRTMHFIKSIKRKLYHSTGLGKTDFVTYFESYSQIWCMVVFHIRRPSC